MTTEPEEELWGLWTEWAEMWWRDWSNSEEWSEDEEAEEWEWALVRWGRCGRCCLMDEITECGPR